LGTAPYHFVLINSFYARLELSARSLARGESALLSGPLSKMIDYPISATSKLLSWYFRAEFGYTGSHCEAWKGENS